jgi:hypothetical protein
VSDLARRTDGLPIAGRVSEVGPQGQHVRSKNSGRFVQGFPVSAGNCHASSFLDEGSGGGEANTDVAACDQGGPARKSHSSASWLHH